MFFIFVASNKSPITWRRNIFVTIFVTCWRWRRWWWNCILIIFWFRAVDISDILSEIISNNLATLVWCLTFVHCRVGNLPTDRDNLNFTPSQILRENICNNLIATQIVQLKNSFCFYLRITNVHIGKNGNDPLDIFLVLSPPHFMQLSNSRLSSKSRLQPTS